jgi:UDP-N-acetylglucosamine--N-acetylmuramyl-(pentapeptide) pyrophosphoryl-undecaprenol N-acetylglucosamine transferase
MKIIISGGGTGGHIFPAISIANAIRETDRQADILFVGALGKMEMEKVPAAGYRIVGLPVAGFQRRLTWKNVTFFFKLAASMLKARNILKTFKPDVVVGVGGYASGPLLRMATKLGIPALIQEQNSYPGITNKLLAPRVNCICVAYDGMEKFFPAEKIKLTGNPVRQDLLRETDYSAAAKFFDLDPNKKTILVIGGSLGARSLNDGVLAGIDRFIDSDIQVLWQTGKLYFDEISTTLGNRGKKYIKLFEFISRMDLAYTLCSLVVSRAGASSISEIALLGKAAILIPSPNVAEDHQTRNAIALSEVGAAILLKDDKSYQLADVALNLIHDEPALNAMRSSVLCFARPDASSVIASEVFKLAKR